ncbi:MAG: hypothetical protein AAF513_07995 [Pseudomonadota bacterium]
MNHSNDQLPDEQALQRLLELRDVDPAALTPQDAPLVAHLRDLREQLNDLPQETIDPALWRDATAPTAAPVESVHSATPPWLRYRFAAAAAVFLVSLVGMLALLPSGEPVNTPQISASAPLYDGTALASLMRQSRDLERLLTGQGAGAMQAADRALAPALDLRQSDATERSLRYRLVDIDAQIARLYDTPKMDEQRRLVLWQHRVDVLRSLVMARVGSGDRLQSLNSRSM